jgi:hypothetical protein
MSRNLILALGALVWALAALDAVVHLADGEWMAPGLAAIVLVVWVSLRLAQRFARSSSDQGAAATQ